MPEIETRPSEAAKGRRRAGTAALEFALFGPFLLILLVGVVELGFVMYQAMQVYNAVEAGTVYAAKNGWDEAGIASAVVNASAVSGLTATPAPTQFCGCPEAGGIVETTCDSTCVDGNPPGRYVRINAALPRQTILPYPALPLPATLTAQSVLRLN